MKTETLDKNQEVTLTIHPDWQAQPFTVSGGYESVLPISEAVQAEDSKQPVKRTVKLPKQVVEPPTFVLEGRKATLHAKLYDMTHGTSMYQLLKEKRTNDRNVAFAAKLGLLSVEDVSCRKHQAAIAKLHNL